MYNLLGQTAQLNRITMRSQKKLNIIKSSSNRQPMSTMRMATVLICTFCLIACLLPARPVECGRLQEFFQNLVGGGSSSSNSNSNSNSGSSNSNSGNSNSNSNSNSDSNDSDTAASSDSNSDQPMTPMMSASMNPFMRYPSFYDSFGPASYGGYPGMSGMSFSNPMSAMSGLSPMAAMSSNPSLSGAFSPASFGPASFGSFGSSSFGSSSANPLSSFGSSSGMSASSLNNIYASQPNLMGGYTPYYGRRR